MPQKTLSRKKLLTDKSKEMGAQRQPNPITTSHDTLAWLLNKPIATQWHIRLEYIIHPYQVIGQSAYRRYQHMMC